MTVPQRICLNCHRVSYERGGALEIEAARVNDGIAPAADFIDKLRTSRRSRDLKRLADVLVRFEVLAATGNLEIPRELNQLTETIYEIKAGDVRLPFYYTTCKLKPVVRLTHGFIKGTVRAPLGEIRRAKWVMEKDRNNA